MEIFVWGHDPLEMLEIRFMLGEFFKFFFNTGPQESCIFTQWLAKANFLVLPLANVHMVPLVEVKRQYGLS